MSGVRPRSAPAGSRPPRAPQPCPRPVPAKFALGQCSPSRVGAMPETHSRRRAALRTRLQERELDALLLADLRNVHYLTGFTGSNAALLVHAGDDARTVFCTDGRYLTQSSRQVPDLERIIERPCAPALAA